MKSSRRTLSALSLALAFLFGQPVLAATETAPPESSPANTVARAEAIETRPGDVTYDAQPGQMVYQVLLAEIALQRGNPALASEAYADLAMRTRDPKVLERTVEVAGFARQFDIALKAVHAWLEIEPSSIRAQQMLVSVLVLSNQLDELAPNLIRLLQADQAGLAQNLLGLNRMFARQTDRLGVFVLLEKVCRSFFGMAEAHYTVAMAASSAGITERALAEVQRALELRPDWEQAALLEAQVRAGQSNADAIRFLEDFVKRNPKARDVQLQLARALIGEKRYADAKANFDQLLVDYPDRPEVVFPAAMLALQQNDRAYAETQLKRFLTLDVSDKSVAYYYLGQIAEDGERADEAVADYLMVDVGEQYLMARIRAARLLRADGKLEEGRRLLAEAETRSDDQRVSFQIAEAGLLRDAGQIEAAFYFLEQALAANPDQPELLYETSLLAEKLGRMELLESRLRRLITLRPDQPQAYNALGYSYADRNMKLPEARQLIEQALKLSPDDVFIRDSMGWVLYRQGDLAGALEHLEGAYSQRADPEIAAHLGEVLWHSGRKDDARRLLQEARQKHPDNESLAKAASQFAP